MNEIFARALVLVCAGISFLLLMFCFIIYQINRKKGLISLILAVIFIAITGYYCYTTLFTSNTISDTMRCLSRPPASTTQEQPSNQITLTVETDDGNQIIVENGDALDITSDVSIKITGASQNGKPLNDIRVNVIGFTPKDNPSQNNDIGYRFSYKDMLKKFAIDEEKIVYRVEIKRSDEKLGEIYLRFVK
ncbi:MAG TPA: M99 family metallo-carboxypeptidase C-terminal domain-containing protein [bacterium]|nr:M99 family metallo-carboxypeptidase C-terminal domain-containing protein [bacterium]